jgi:hypothetical protein
VTTLNRLVRDAGIAAQAGFLFQKAVRVSMRNRFFSSIFFVHCFVTCSRVPDKTTGATLHYLAAQDMMSSPARRTPAFCVGFLSALFSPAPLILLAVSRVRPHRQGST